MSNEIQEEQREQKKDEGRMDGSAAKKARGQSRGLGRGLDALFGDAEPEFAGEKSANFARRTLNVADLRPGGSQPRRLFDDDALDLLAVSISTHGMLQPIVCRAVASEPGQYEIIAGERRWRAAQRAQLHDVPVIIHEIDDESALEIALIENLQREDLNPLDEAEGYRRLMDEFSHTQEKLASSIGKSRSHIANMVRLLNLPDGIQAMLRDGKISGGHARALIGAQNPEDLARLVAQQGLNVRQTEQLVRDQQNPKGKGKGASGKKSSAPVQKDVDTLALEQEVSAALGMNVAIDVKGKGGMLRVSFQNLDQLDEVLHRLSHYPGSRLTG